MKDLEALSRALDEWATAEDRANEAAAALSHRAALGKGEGKLADVRALQRLAAEHLEAVRKLLAADSHSNEF